MVEVSSQRRDIASYSSLLPFRILTSETPQSLSVLSSDGRGPSPLAHSFPLRAPTPETPRNHCSRREAMAEDPPSSFSLGAALPPSWFHRQLGPAGVRSRRCSGRRCRWLVTRRRQLLQPRLSGCIPLVEIFNSFYLSCLVSSLHPQLSLMRFVCLLSEALESSFKKYLTKAASAVGPRIGPSNWAEMGLFVKAEGCWPGFIEPSLLSRLG
ncbi:hypothetical protein AAHA92_32755 [Salvia divinorum]|uniref:Uncharacterized protein n=1 Tax=Salvia divinorum TaxID=28513 RepID=A0ABD1FLR5_SALDI